MTSGEPKDGGEELSRRRLLFGGAGAVAAVGGGRAIYNTRLGYGELGMGTNLHEQDLVALTTKRLSTDFDETIDETPIQFDGSTITVGSNEKHTLSLAADDREDVVEVDKTVGMGGQLENLFVDLAAIESGEYTVEFHQPRAFFERFEGAAHRPGIVTAIRGLRDRAVDPEIIEAFADSDPAAVPELVDGLISGFREHTSYDITRYLAGSIEDNVLFGAVDLRKYFEQDVDFESLLEADETGIFCWELVYRSIEALQALPPTDQTIPIACCYVSDIRHKHAFTGVLGAIREDGELRLPMTFLDYTHSTLYDDLKATAILGEGLAAYNRTHRADEIYW